jgi:hypothetical protein
MSADQVDVSGIYAAALGAIERGSVQELRFIAEAIVDALAANGVSSVVCLSHARIGWYIQAAGGLEALGLAHHSVQTVTELIDRYGGGGGGGQQTRETPPRTCVETTLGELAKGIPITIGKKADQ